MQNSKQNDFNWLVKEFTSIDLIAAIKTSNIQSSETITTIKAGNDTITYKSSSTENDVEGRPISTRHYNEEGGIEEEYKYEYTGNIQKIELYIQQQLNCYWVNEYDADTRLIRSEYVDMDDDAHDIETFEYDEDGRLVRMTTVPSPKDVEEGEPNTYFIFEWEGNQLKSMLEVYGEEEEARMDFEYNDTHQIITVRKYIYLVDDDNKEMQELVDEQNTTYNEAGQLAQNTVNYYTSGAKLIISYEYDETGHAVRTYHDDYEGEELVRSIEFHEDASGNLQKSVERFKSNGVVKTDIFTYTYQ